jgi:iron complex outermembrane receptor protein
MNTIEPSCMNRGHVRHLACVAIAILAATAAFAQTTPAADDTVKLEKFVVTGSNIPTAATALAVPVTVIGQQKMEQTGVSSDLLDILRKGVPNISGIGQENATISSGNTLGGASVTVKGLGTLVLINGRRVAFSPAESTGGYQFVDLNLIPPAAIEQVEVLSDGASAVYGSDAVGGVINVILKKEFNGWEVGGHYGFSRDDGDYKEKSGYLVGGVSNGKTSILIGADYTEHDAILMKDRAITNPIYGTRSYPGIIDVTNLATGVDQFYQLAANLNAPPGGGTRTIADLVASGVYKAISDDEALHVYNLANGQTLAGYLKRYSALINLTHKFSDNLEGFADVIAANTKTWSQLNAQPVVPYLQNAYIDINVFFGFTPPPAGTTYVPTTSPVNPFSTAFVNQAADGNTGNLVFVRNRFIDFPRVYRNDTTLFRAVGGLKGKINENYSWEAAANLNRIQLQYTNNGVIATAALQDALNNGTINPFARTQAAGAFNGVVGTAFVNMVSTLNSFDFTLRGTPFDLPAGKTGFALGAVYLREGLAATPDTNSLPNSTGTTQGWSNATTFNNFNAVRGVTSYFAEAEVPLIGANQGITAVHALNLDVAVRYDDYGSSVGSSTVPKYSVSWQPFDEHLKVRASAGKSFVAPQLYSLYGPIDSGASQGITYTTLGGVQKTNIQFNSTGGANPALKPSTATTWSAGFVWTPKQLKNLSVTVDYSDIKQSGIVGVVPQGTIIQSVETNGTASPYIGLVRLNTPTGPMLTGAGQISTRSPQAIWILNQKLNLGGTNVRSTDIAVDYVFPTLGDNRFSVSTAATWYHSYKIQTVTTEPFYEYAGAATKIIGGAGTVPTYRTFTTLTWRNRAWDAFISHTFVPSVDDIGTGGSSASAPVPVASYHQFDLGLAYDFKTGGYMHWLDGLKVSVGVNNVFNKQAPLALNAFEDSNADVATYSGSIGRMFYVNAKFSF